MICADQITNIMLSGVGGQGIIRTSNILAEVAFRAGHDVKKSEIHGLAQRGGDVYSHVRFGTKIHAPVIMDGDAHFLVALEELEALRYAHFVRPEGLILVNDLSLLPTLVSQKKFAYPEDIDARIGEYARMERIPATRLATEAGNPKAANLVMLGALSVHLGIELTIWREVIAAGFAQKFARTNLAAFDLGTNAGRAR